MQTSLNKRIKRHWQRQIPYTGNLLFDYQTRWKEGKVGGGADLKWPGMFPHFCGEIKNPPHLSNDAYQYIP